MITLIKTDQPDFYSIQRATVGYTFSDLSFKYTSIPLSKELRIICQIIPSREMPNNFCYTSITVIQFQSLSSLNQILLSTPLHCQFRMNDVRSLENVDAKTIDVSVILKKSSEVLKWKSTENCVETIRDVLYFFMIVHSSVVVLPSSKQHFDIAYICINSTSSKKSACRVTSSTVININEVLSLDKFQRRCENESVKIVGLSNQLKFLNSIYNVNVRLKKSRGSFGTKYIQKVLIIGPSGCGKSTLVNSFAKNKKCGLIVIEGSQLSNSTPGESENILRSYFDEAIKRSEETEEDVCIVHLDQIENICRKSKSAASHLRRLSSQLFQILETIDENPGVIIIATTSDVNSLDPVVRHSTRIQIEMYVGMPNEKERQEILQLHKSILKPSICKKIAACSPGYNGADLAFLVQNIDRLVDGNWKRNEADLLKLFDKCLRTHIPSSMRGGLGTVRLRDTAMNHLGGLDEIKSSLRYYVEWPLKYTGSFKRLGIPIPKGILLYGPPGCAKTSLACAIANSTNTNFLSISAAELYSPYVGEAEKNVIELFQKARMNNPCILFIDEIDALVGNRETSSKNVQTKILSTFLTEMDGITNAIDWATKDKETENTVVIVIAATNRPDKLDSALLRPGRFDKLIYVSLPGQKDRLDILRNIVHHSKISLSRSVDLTEISEKTTNFSGADLKNLLREAGYLALFEEGMSVTQIKHEHILKSLSLMRPSILNTPSYNYEQFLADKSSHR